PPPAQAPTATPPPGEPGNVAPPPATPPATTTAPETTVPGALGPAATPSTLTPEPPVAPPLVLEQRTPQAPAKRPVPFYRKDWFWGTIGLVVLTTAIVLVSVSSSDSAGP